MKTSLQRLAAAAATVLLAVGASAHSGKALFHVIVDTDGAADDLRTLCILLSDNRAEVMAVVSSDGAQSPRRTAQCVAAMLEEFYHEGIPVGEGRAVCTSARARRLGTTVRKPHLHARRRAYAPHHRAGVGARHDPRSGRTYQPLRPRHTLSGADAAHRTRGMVRR